MKKPKAIFLDWDGTLVDSYAFLNAAHDHVRVSFAMAPFAPGEFRPYFGMPREALYTKIYGDQWQEARARFEAYVRANHMKAISPLPGAAELVKAIGALNIPAGIVSNKRGEFVRAEVENLGWSGIFPIVIGSGDAAADKPAADPLLLGVSRGAVTLGESLYVGDSETDAACAQAAGCRLILILDGHGDQGWVKKYDPISILANCDELEVFIKNFS